jgi:hypothetical protein
MTTTTAGVVHHRGLVIWRITLGLYVSLLICISVSAYLRILPNELPRFPHFDQLAHLLLIGLAAPLADRALRLRTVLRWLPLGPLIIAVVAGSEELAQTLSPVRSCSWLDASADLTGIVLFTVLGRLIVRFTGR